MCMIWLKPQGKTLPRVFWDAINSYNPHGLGIYNIKANEIFKTQDYEAGWKYINDHIEDQMVVHHRLSTSGAQTCEQIHGWDMQNGNVFFHNGILSTYKGGAGKSDTQNFVEEWMGTPLKPMVKYLELAEKNSRFVLIDRNTGEITIPNCARWNPVYIKEIGETIQFSNDYAFRYSMLPASYSRWSGYDDDWRYNSMGYATKVSTPKKTRTTRSGAKTTKRVVSVFEKSLAKNAKRSIEIKGTINHIKTRNTYTTHEFPLEMLSRPDLAQPKTDIYKLQDVYRLGADNTYVLGDDLYNYLKNGDLAFPSLLTIEYADLISMNDVMTCESADIAKVFIRLARASNVMSEATQHINNTDFFKFIRSYELRIGYRETVDLTLPQFLELCGIASAYWESTGSDLLDGMQIASLTTDIVADMLNEGFSYFKSFKKRFITQYTKEHDALVEAEQDKLLKKSSSKHGGWVLDNMGKYVETIQEYTNNKLGLKS